MRKARGLLGQMYIGNGHGRGAKGRFSRNGWRWRVSRGFIENLIRNPALVPFYVRFYIWLGTKEWLWRAGRDRRTVAVVSYPCSGRTWLDAMMTIALREDFGFSEGHATTMRELSVLCRDIPFVRFTHAGSSWLTHVARAEETGRFSPERHAADMNLVLWRDPRDVLVSSYYHALHRNLVRDITPEHLIEDSVIGIRKVVAFYNAWAKFSRHYRDSTLWVRYEELRSDTKSVLNDAMRALRMPVSEHALEKAINETSFERMQERERSGSVHTARAATVSPGEKDAYKVRSGRSGQYKEFFSREQQGKIEAYIKEHLDPELKARLDL